MFSHNWVINLIALSVVLLELTLAIYVFFTFQLHFPIAVKTVIWMFTWCEKNKAICLCFLANSDCVLVFSYICQWAKRGLFLCYLERNLIAQSHFGDLPSFCGQNTNAYMVWLHGGDDMSFSVWQKHCSNQIKFVQHKITTYTSSDWDLTNRCDTNRSRNLRKKHWGSCSSLCVWMCVYA